MIFLGRLREGLRSEWKRNPDRRLGGYDEHGRGISDDSGRGRGAERVVEVRIDGSYSDRCCVRNRDPGSISGKVRSV